MACLPRSRRNYFESVPTAENKAFVEALRLRHGQDYRVSDPLEAAYLGVSTFIHASLWNDLD